MKRLMIYSKYTGKGVNGIFEKLKAESTIIVLFSFFLCGLIIGCIIYSGSNENLKLYIDTLMKSYFLSVSGGIKVFLNSFVLSALFLLLSFCGGLCCVGIPLIFALPVIKGLFYGTVASFLLSCYAMQGFGYFALTVLPGAVISVCAVIIACNYASFMTKSLAFNVFSGKHDEIGIKPYLFRLLILLAVVFASALVDLCCIKLFSGLFSF